MRFLAIFVFYSSIAYCQTLEVTYSLQIDMSGEMGVPFNHTYELINSNGVSLQRKYMAQMPDMVRKDNRKATLVDAANDTSYVFKNFLNDDMYSEERVFTNTFDVKDQLSIFKWEYLSDTTSILSHACKKAKTFFRGRLYEVFYTEEIPVPDGPAKFNGLPGLILKVKMIDEKSIYEIEAVRLSTNPQTVVIVNPYQNKKVMPFDAYRKFYLRKYAELEAYAKTKDGFKVHRGGVELLE